jgi:hypothetical protein
MEIQYLFEMSVSTYNSTRRYNPQKQRRHLNRREIITFLSNNFAELILICQPLQELGLHPIFLIDLQARPGYKQK